MSNIEKIRQEIERRKKICEGIFERDSDTYYQGKAVAYGELLPFIDSLPEEKPSDDLEEAAEMAARKIYPYEGGMKGLICENAIPIYKAGFIAGAEWQKEQMMKDAVEGFIFQSEDYYPKELVAQYNGELKHGDKVKIIIVKQ